MYKNLKELSDHITMKPKTLIVAAAHDMDTLKAVYSASKKFRMRYILVGDREKIISFTSQLGYTPDNTTIIDCKEDAECAEKAVALIRQGTGGALMKGIIETGILLKAVLNKENGIRGTGTLSHLAILEPPEYHKLIGITDGGMIPNPTPDQKRDIVINAVKYYRSIGYEDPKIAALCASETINPKIQETVDAAELQDMCRKGDLGICTLEGPLSFDIAISKESAQKKGVTSEISGDTDIFLVPNITVGNVLAKGIIYWAKAKMAGCILGAQVPIVLTSRGASDEEKLYSIMMSLSE